MVVTLFLHGVSSKACAEHVAAARPPSETPPVQRSLLTTDHKASRAQDTAFLLFSETSQLCLGFPTAGHLPVLFDRSIIRPNDCLVLLTQGFTKGK